VGGNSYTSPVIANGRVFVNRGGWGFLYCLYENNGTEIWNRTIGLSGQRSSTPAVDNGRVFVVGDKVYCFYENNGTEIWKKTVTGGEIGTSSPTVAEGKVFIYTKNFYCFYANNGTELWNKSIGGTGYATPAVANGKVYINGQNFYCFYTNNGTEIWNIAGGTSNSPVIANGMIYFNPGTIKCLYPNNGTELWSQFNSGDSYSSPAVSNDKVIVNDGSIFYCYYAINGTQIWSKSIVGSAYTTPAFAANDIVVINGGNNVYVLNASDGTEIWKKTVGASQFSSPAIANGRIFFNLGAIYCFGPSITDLVLPTVIDVYPVNGAINTSSNVNITISFNESMNQSASQSAFSISPNLSGSYSWQGKSMTFDPDTDLSPSTTYTITLNTNAKDLAGNRLDGNDNGVFDDSPIDDFSWSFTTRENTSPKIISTNPKNNDVNMSLDIDIEITFNELMNHSSAELAFSSYPSQSGSFSWTGNTLTFTPNNDLNQEYDYFITIASSATDEIGNFLDGNSNGLAEGSPTDDYTWQFSTKEITPPRIITTNPKDLATDLPLNTNIQVTFNEPMNHSATESAFDISPSVLGTFSWNGNILTFIPNSELTPEKQYTVTISTEAKDLIGNSLDGDDDGIAEGSPNDDYSWRFYTGARPDETSPYVLFIEPDYNAMGVNIDSKIRVIFSEPMNKPLTKIGFRITPNPSGAFNWDDTGKEMSFFPASKLNYETKYTITLNSSSAQDLAGNLLDGNNNSISEGSPIDDYGWSFTTISEPVNDISPPKIITTYPEDKTDFVNVNTNIEIIFDEEMNQSSSQNAFSLSPMITGTFRWDFNNMIFDPDADLEYNIKYSVKIDSSATDLTGNSLDSNGNDISEGSPVDDYFWVFTTIQDQIEPLHGIAITGMSEINIQIGENKSFPILIENIGNVEDTFIADVKANTTQDFVSLSDYTSNTLRVNENWTIDLIVDVPLDAEIGNFLIIIYVTSIGGNFTSHGEITLNILPLAKLTEKTEPKIDDFNILPFIIGIILTIVIILIILFLIIFSKKRREKDTESEESKEQTKSKKNGESAEDIDDSSTDHVEWEID
jgi:outer membrane protein assembly factor BamB